MIGSSDLAVKVATVSARYPIPIIFSAALAFALCCFGGAAADNPAEKIQSLLTERRWDIHPRLRHGSEDFEYRLFRKPAAAVTDTSLSVERD